MDLEDMIQQQMQLATQHQQHDRHGQEITCLESVLFMQKQCLLGKEPNQKIAETSTLLASRYNAYAMQYLDEEHYQIAQDLLQKSLGISEALKSSGNFENERQQIRALTFSNMGCLYKRVGRLLDAQTSAARALRIEKRYPGSGNEAASHLNMCAILSERGRHRSAIEHAYIALNFLRKRLNHTLLNKKKNEIVSAAMLTSLHTTMTIAYYNVAVEQEHLHRFDLALDSYHRAYEFSYLYMGNSHDVTKTLYFNLQRARQANQQQLRYSNPAKYTSFDNKFERDNAPTFLSSVPLHPATRIEKQQMTLTPFSISHKPFKPRRQHKPSSRISSDYPRPAFSLRTSRAKDRKKHKISSECSILNSTSFRRRSNTRSSFQVIQSLFGVAPWKSPRSFDRASNSSCSSSCTDIEDNDTLKPRAQSCTGVNATNAVLLTARPAPKVLVEVAVNGDGYWSDGPIEYSCHGKNAVSVTPMLSPRTVMRGVHESTRSSFVSSNLDNMNNALEDLEARFT